MSPDSVLHMLQRVLKRAGLERIRFHDLRHPNVKPETKNFYSANYVFKKALFPLLHIKQSICNHGFFDFCP